MVETTCAACGVTFKTWPRTLRRVKRPTCSRQCNGRLRGAEWATHGAKGRAGWTDASRESYRQKMTGARNPAWKGGVTLKRPKGNYRGVRYMRAPTWALPMARADGYVMEHRLVMARLVGRLLARTEVVHHRDHDPANNTPSNLELWPSNGSHKAAEHGRVVPGVANRWLPRSSVVR
jgi:hypothetical protein